MKSFCLFHHILTPPRWVNRVMTTGVNTSGDDNKYWCFHEDSKVDSSSDIYASAEKRETGFSFEALEGRLISTGAKEVSPNSEEIMECKFLQKMKRMSAVFSTFHRERYPGDHTKGETGTRDTWRPL